MTAFAKRMPELANGCGHWQKRGAGIYKSGTVINKDDKGGNSGDFDSLVC